MGFLNDSRNSRPWSSRISNTSSETLEVEEKFLDSSSIESGSIEESQEKEIAQTIDRSRRRLHRGLRYLTVVNVLLFGATILLNLFPVFLRHSEEMNHCVKETSYYSPIFDAKEIKFHDIHLNGTLWPPEHEAWSRREFGDPEAEKIWEDWEPVDTFPITREQVIALGKDPETAARYPDDYWGMGDDAYIASLDVLHKIHCVNELRKMTFADYGADAPTKHQHGQLWWIHLRHCVDMLTQDMLCHADADLITYNWRDTQRHPFPDFGINRQCRSMDPLIEYRDENRVDMTKYMAMPKPTAGIHQLEYEPGYYAMYGFDGSDLYPDGKGYDMSRLPDTNKWFGIKPNLTALEDAAHSHG